MWNPVALSMPISSRTSAWNTLPCARGRRSLSCGYPTGRWTGVLSRRVQACERCSCNVFCDLWLDSYALWSRATRVKCACYYRKVLAVSASAPSSPSPLSSLSTAARLAAQHAAERASLGGRASPWRELDSQSPHTHAPP